MYTTLSILKENLKEMNDQVVNDQAILASDQVNQDEEQEIIEVKN